METKTDLIVMSGPDKAGFKKAFDFCKMWGSEHQAEIGVVEMAMGAGLIYWGLQNGLIEMGTDVVGSKWADIGGAAGVSLGSVGGPVIAATFLKSIFVGGVSGVAGVTSIAALPVIALVGGGAAIFGAFGYTAGGLAGKVADAFAPSFADYVVDASIVTVGLALMIDGARRVANDDRVLAAASKFENGVIQLASEGPEIVANTWEELQKIIKELANEPILSFAKIGVAGATGVGAAVGGSVAAGTVTVLGSHGIGALALSLGIVSAPVWPVIAGGAAGLAIGVAAWKGVKHFKNKSNNHDSGSDVAALLPSPDNK